MIDMLTMEPTDFDECSRYTGFRALFCAVVLIAVNDALGLSRVCGENKITLKRRALNWINSPDEKPGSLRWYCIWIDVDADALRESVNERCGLPRDLSAASRALERAA